MPVPKPSKDSHTHNAAFHTTRWSIVLGAQGKASRDAFESLEALCRQYWSPLYAYVRQRGFTPHEAEDLTQEFFARLLEKEWLAAAKRECGRFRSFLLMALKRFLANEWDRSQALKRGGGCEVISLDAETAESLYATNIPALPAESLYEKRWALTVLGKVMLRLKTEHEAAGRAMEYEVLKPSLTADRREIHYEALAEALSVGPASARSAVHRLWKRFREVFREEVAGTVADPSEVDDEMRAVIAALGNL
jgi:DNA-directed RNA polymerase specialized sigma24 family protein